MHYNQESKPNSQEDPFRLNNFVYKLNKEKKEKIKQGVIQAAREGDIQKVKEIIENLERLSRETEGFKETELLPEELPVLVHRWFPDGDNWAYNSLLSDKFVEIVRGLSKILDSRKMGDSKVKISHDQWVIGTMREDITTKDPKAKNRSPFYYTGAVIDGAEPKDEKLAEIYRQLKALPEVEQNGSNENLSIGGKNKKGQ